MDRERNKTAKGPSKTRCGRIALSMDIEPAEPVDGEENEAPPETSSARRLAASERLRRLEAFSAA